MTSSRLRSNVATYFDVCCEVRRTFPRFDNPNRGCSLNVLYPTEFDDKALLKSIPQFCFPCNSDIDESDAVQLFTFALTDSAGQYTFGYCRYTPGINTCLCILSGLSASLWATHFYKFLNHLSNVVNNGTNEDVESLLTNAYCTDVQQYFDGQASGAKLTLNACTPIGKFSEDVPDNTKLPTLSNDKIMLEFYNAINERQMIPLFCSLLKERRIIFTSRKLSQLSSCVFAASRLLYPFHWQNLFIPMLPTDLTDMLMAPMPYIIGVPKQTFERVNRKELGEVVIVDLDEKTFESPFTDTEKVPPDILAYLRGRLKSSSEMFLSDGMARSFLQTNVLIFGKYAKGFVKNGSSNGFIWDRDVFVNNQRPTLQPFLNLLIGRDGVQYFERFVEERLKALNSGVSIQDEFEKEIVAMEAKRTQERNGGYAIRQGKPPEVIQQAVTNVKENANEVLGALKDRVQAISIKDKFGRFTPTTEVRRRKLNPRHHRKKKVIDPLSVDASQYDFNNPLAQNSTSTSDDKRQSVSDAESVHSEVCCEDLIDLSEDPPAVVVPQSAVYFTDSKPVSQACPYAFIRSAPLRANTISPTFNLPANVVNNGFPSANASSTTSQNHSSGPSHRKGQWETFD